MVTPYWTCWTVYWSTLSFDSPMRETQDTAQFVQMAQTLCYDLARAEKAKDGKKWFRVFFCSNALIAFARSLCKCLLAVKTHKPTTQQAKQKTATKTKNNHQNGKLSVEWRHYMVSSPYEPRFVLVPIRFASKAWPRPGLACSRPGVAWPRLALPRPRQTSKQLDCRLASI